MLRPVAVTTILAGLLSCTFSSHAAPVGNSLFRVHVPPFMNIVAPVESSTITHDESNSNQRFPRTTWWAIGTSQFGHTVTLSTTQAFTHENDPSHKRDVRLRLTRNFGTPNWTIDAATDTTDYAAAVPDEIATVQASSTGPALARFRLRVVFITDDFTTLPHGNYETTVVGTITANH